MNTPIRNLDESFVSRFWNMVSQSDSCWTWTGAKDRQGYGMIGCNRKALKAHRVSWAIHHGEIPDELCVLHKCDNPSCVNPQHLWLGTNLQNVQDKMRKGRFVRCSGEFKSGELHPKAKLSRSDVVQIRSMYSTKEWTLSELSEIFGVKFQSVWQIVKFKTWKTLKSDEV